MVASSGHEILLAIALSSYNDCCRVGHSRFMMHAQFLSRHTKLGKLGLISMKNVMVCLGCLDQVMLKCLHNSSSTLIHILDVLRGDWLGACLRQCLAQLNLLQL
eukprot:scaffold2126_cov417-Prasinococcus_capsulatus_cf.AAC.11